MRFCPCFGSEEAKGVADRDPVLLVSGMGGSIVNSKPKKFGFTTRVWVRLLLADVEFRNKIWSLYNPQTGPCLTLLLLLPHHPMHFNFSVQSSFSSKIGTAFQVTLKRWTRRLKLWSLTMITASMRSIFWTRHG